MKKAVYPGSFDPLSNGHLDLIRRAARMFDELHVVVANNVNKKSSFTASERVEMVKLATEGIPNVVVVAYDGLVVQYCRENKIQIIVRGMRNFSDYENEFTLFHYNRDFYPEVETILLMPTTKNQVVSSSAIKELVAYGIDIKKYVPACIADKIVTKLKKQ